MWLCHSERGLQLSADQRLQPFCLLRTARCPSQHAAGENDIREVGFHNQPAPELLHHDHELSRAAIEAAVVLTKWHCGPAEVGKRGPDFSAKTGITRRILLAACETVLVGDELLDAVDKHRLNFGKRKIHE